MASNIHTTSANAVMLVWGSLRLAPINHFYVFINIASIMLVNKDNYKEYM